MRILFLTQVLPYPLDAGPKVRAYYTLRHLAERGHGVTLVSFVRPTDTPEALARLSSLCEQVITVPMSRARWRDGLALGRSLVTGVPLLVARDRVSEMFRRIRAVVTAHSYDAVHADQLWMAPYALAAGTFAAQHGRRPRRVLDQHNAVYLIPARLASAARSPLARLFYQREAERMRSYEAWACLGFDQVVTVSDSDRASLLALYQNGRLPRMGPVIPICIDPDTTPVRRQTPEAGPLLFVGGLHWPPNADGVEWFAQEVLPRVRGHLPQTRLLAVGQRPPPALAAMANAGIDLPGHVDDLGPIWEQSPAFVVPLRAGGGVRVKILDAWAHGVPVIATRIGAEGLAYAPGHNLLVADTAEQFADAVCRVLTEPGLAARLVRGGRQTLEECYSWRTVYRAWDDLYPLSASASRLLKT